MGVDVGHAARDGPAQRAAVRGPRVVVEAHTRARQVGCGQVRRIGTRDLVGVVGLSARVAVVVLAVALSTGANLGREARWRLRSASGLEPATTDYGPR